MAQAIGDFMNTCGGEIYVPYAFLAENNIITVFDQAVHETADDDAGTTAWKTTRPPSAGCSTPAPSMRAGCKIQRPGHRHRRRIEPDHARPALQPEANFYQAPLHVKANGGVFLIDDFGRQLCSPKELLNRWIVPLENRLDFLSLASRQEVPGAVRAAHHLLDQPRSEGPGRRRLPAPYSAQGRDHARPSATSTSRSSTVTPNDWA